MEQSVTERWDVEAMELAITRFFGGRWEFSRFGPDGIVGQRGVRSIIITWAEHDDWGEWVHASVARTDKMPTYEDLVRLHAAVWGPSGFAYQVFASDDRHVNIHTEALHLWGRRDGANVLPDFGKEGTI